MTALIIDDEPLSRQELHFLLEEAGVDVIGQGSNGIEAVDLIGRLQPDIVFLDVQMPGLDGFAVLKKLLDRQMPMPQIVFATAFDQYAVRAFEVNAVDYLLKPFETRRVLLSLEKARARLQPGESAGLTAAGDTTTPVEGSTEAKLDALLRLVEQRGLTRPDAPAAGGANKVVLRAQQRLLLVEQREICFASIEEGAISVVTPSMRGLSNCRTLEELAEQLNPDLFWRAHRSFLVNLQHISEVVPWFKSSYQLRMDDPKHTEIPVSRAQTKRLRELFKL